jgi:hypothetical protein
MLKSKQEDLYSYLKMQIKNYKLTLIYYYGKLVYVKVILYS